MPLLELHGVLSKFCAFKQVLLIQQSIRFHAVIFLISFSYRARSYHLVKVVTVSAYFKDIFRVNMSMHFRTLPQTHGCGDGYLDISEAPLLPRPRYHAHLQSLSDQKYVTA
jgi:hypothetical protein